MAVSTKEQGILSSNQLVIAPKNHSQIPLHLYFSLILAPYLFFTRFNAGKIASYCPKQRQRRSIQGGLSIALRESSQSN